MAGWELTSDMQDLTLPKPLGLMIQKSAPVTVETGVTVVLTIEYDVDASNPSRLAVVSDAAASKAGSWQRQASNDGRLLALSGAAITTARSLVLEDVTTNTVVWTANHDAAVGFGQHNSFVRLGASVVANHTYRLRLEGATNGGDAPIIALALPR